MPYELFTQDNIYHAQEEATKPVEVIYAGTGLHKITGATPYITFNRTSNLNENREIQSTTVNVNLEGTIVRNGVDTGLTPPGSGLTSMMGAVEALKNLLSSPTGDFGTYNNVLKVKCDNSEIFTASGVRLVSLNFEKSSDNWIQTVPFNAVLEYVETGNDDKLSYVKSTTHQWSIEPLEEYQYTSYTTGLKIPGSETHNPKLKPTAPTASSPQPADGLGGGSFGGGAGGLTVIDIPRFKISRTLSAAGVPSGTGNPSTNNAYLMAKAWVESTAVTAFSGSANSFIPAAATDSIADIDTMDKNTFLYNHLRSVNFSIGQGTYSIVDTWLAMPSAVSYLEDYTVESSTDENHIKTVSVQGEIRGLKVSNLNSFSSMKNGLGYVQESGGSINLDLSISNGSASDPSTGPTTSNNTASDQSLSAARYETALNGWIEDIKPYMYRRASSVLGSIERTTDYYQPSNAHNQRNPIFSKEHPLNAIPVSTSETHNMQKGSLLYNYQFDNRFSYLSGVLSENLSVDVKGPSDVVNEAFVLGRRLGPVIQNLGSRTSTEQTATLEISVMPPSSIDGVVRTSNKCPLYHQGELYNSIKSLFSGLQPYGDRPQNLFGNFDQRSSIVNDAGQVYIKRDEEQWNATQGRFSKTVTWLYQPCSNTRSYLDN